MRKERERVYDRGTDGEHGGDGEREIRSKANWGKTTTMAK